MAAGEQIQIEASVAEGRFDRRWRATLEPVQAVEKMLAPGNSRIIFLGLRNRRLPWQSAGSPVGLF